MTFENEAKPKGELVKRLRKDIPWAVTLRHEDKFTAGIPDISVTVFKRDYSRVVWLEAKFEEFEFKGLQHHTLARLGGFYVVYDKYKRVFILDPRKKAEVIVTGKGHGIVIEFVRKQLTV